MASSSPCHRRSYPTDLTDAQWQLIQPLLPPPSSNGRPEKHPRQEIVNAIFYVARNGCAWRLLPHDPPGRRWSAGCDTGHPTAPSTVSTTRCATGYVTIRAATRWSQPASSTHTSVKGADTVGAQTRGYDAGKRSNSPFTSHRGRHPRTTEAGAGHLCRYPATPPPHSGCCQQLRFVMASVLAIFADGGYAGRLVAYARDRLHLTRVPHFSGGFQPPMLAGASRVRWRCRGWWGCRVGRGSGVGGR